MLSFNLRIRKFMQVISTDDIIPGKYKHMYSDPLELAKHIFENLLPGYATTFKYGDAIYCNNIFGIGSSREQAVSSLLAAGVKAVLAPRFGRIFFRNAWNLGLLAIEIEQFRCDDGSNVLIDLTQGFIENNYGSFKITPPPIEMLEIYNEGGLLNKLCKELK